MADRRSPKKPTGQELKDQMDLLEAEMNGRFGQMEERFTRWESQVAPSGSFRRTKRPATSGFGTSEEMLGTAEIGETMYQMGSD